jgi:hypothetical protein
MLHLNVSAKSTGTANSSGVHDVRVDQSFIFHILLSRLSLRGSVLFLVDIEFSVLLRFTASDYPFGTCISK